MELPSTKGAVPVRLGERSYDVVIGPALWDDAAVWQGLPGGDAMVVTNAIVAPLYLDRVRATLQQRHRRVLEVVLPDGEQHQEWAALSLVFDALLVNGRARRTTVYALGG